MTEHVNKARPKQSLAGPNEKKAVLKGRGQTKQDTGQKEAGQGGARPGQHHATAELGSTANRKQAAVLLKSFLDFVFPDYTDSAGALNKHDWACAMPKVLFVVSIF